MKKIILVLLICLSIFGCKISKVYHKLPAGSKEIRIDENNYLYFQLGNKYYCAFENKTSYNYAVLIIFEVDKTIAIEGKGVEQ